MTLEKDLIRSGNLLFRWRGCLPILLTLPTLLAMRDVDARHGLESLSDRWALAALAVSLAGLAIRILAVGYAARGSSGRNTRWQRASELNTTGIYSVVRHPLYLGNFVIWLGIALFSQTWWLVVIFVLAFWLYYERIMLAEEAFLSEKFGREYLDWAEKTPAFFPAWNRWRRPERPFALRRVLRREYSGFFAIIVCFFGLESYKQIMVHGRLVFEPHWVAIFLGGLSVYVALRTLKKMRVLAVQRQ